MQYKFELLQMFLGRSGKQLNGTTCLQLVYKV